jgi:hypothetical protein
MSHQRIKLSFTWCAGFLLLLGLAAPAMAEFSMPEVPGFSNNYPWFNEVSQYRGNQSFQWFLANHPNIASTLARNPGLLYNANSRSQFPALEQYLEHHPYEWQSLNAQNWAEGPAETRWGDYDDQHQWRDAYWWHRNNPNSFYDHHQDWASLDSRWLNEDGAYDGQRRWHYGEWWYNQNPNWVTANHPNWLREHQNWQGQEEQQNYRHQHAMIQENQQDRNFQQRQATHQQDRSNRLQNQQNQQAAIDRRQANLEQQRTMHRDNQRQDQMNRQQHQEQRQADREQSRATHQQNQQARQQQSVNRQNRSDSQHQQADARQQHGNSGKQAQ